jgi:hypothetical protein
MKPKQTNRKLNKKLTLTAAVALLFVAACTELPFTQTPVDAVPPPPVTNLVAEPLPGGVRLTYDLPRGDNDISYVRAEYSYRGEEWTVSSSVYTDTLIIDGIGNIEPLSATVYVVDHSNNRSEGVKVDFTPLTPPIDLIFESMQVLPDFGGVKIAWTNTTNTEIGITVFIEDSLGVMREQNTRFSRDADGEIVFRGYDPVEQHFAARITDKWGNESALKDARVTPLFETLFDRLLFAEVGLPGDNVSASNNRFLRNIWDGSKSTIWVTDYLAPQYFFPMFFTIDLGVTGKLSRFKFWTRPGYYYANYAIKTFEAWGADSYKQNGDYDYWTGEAWKADWEKIGDFAILRPSGATADVNNPTGVDLEAAQAGFEFLVPLEKKNLRYLRFVVHTIWGGGSAMVMAEIEVYGDNTVGN